jgi:hypothetical protein
MALIVAVGILVNSMWAAPTAVLGSQSNFSNNALLDSTNEQRAKNDEAPLVLDTQLTSAAQSKANDMVAKNYWSHNAPDGQTPWSFITAAGYPYQSAGENLAYGFSSAQDTVVGWMNSREHRANILNDDYQDVGFGVASAPNYLGKGPTIVVVAEYGQKGQAVATFTFNVAEQKASDVKSSAIELPAKQVARIQILTGGQAAWSLIAISVLAGAAIAVFLLRHGFRIKRALNQGEAFIVHHPMIDILIVAAIMIGYLLTRTSGLIK